MQSVGGQSVGRFSMDDKETMCGGMAHFVSFVSIHGRQITFTEFIIGDDAVSSTFPLQLESKNTNTIHCGNQQMQDDGLFRIGIKDSLKATHASFPT
jgi:hypothetical protein